jgi:hypothetical protein
MLRCAVSFVVAAYVTVRLTPHDLRALPAETFYEAADFAKSPDAQDETFEKWLRRVSKIFSAKRRTKRNTMPDKPLT